MAEAKELMKNFNHQNILKFFEVKDDDKPLFLVMERANIDLMALVEQKKSDQKLLPLSVVRDVMFDAMTAIEYIHDKGFVHMDLKPENIVIVGNVDTNSYDAKLIDFELCRRYVDDNNQMIPMIISYGTPHYGPPELWQSQLKVHSTRYKRQPYPGDEARDIRKADMWALGHTLCVMLTGDDPFPGMEFNSRSGIDTKLKMFQLVSDRDFFLSMPAASTCSSCSRLVRV